MFILDRYIALSFLGYYLIAGFSFVGLFMLVDAMEHFETLMKSRSLLGHMVEYYTAALPGVCYRVGPALAVMAAMFTVTRLSRNNELTPIKACGISVRRLCLPILVMAVLLAFALSAVQEMVVPRFSEEIRAATDRQDEGAQRGLRPPLFADGDGNIIYMSVYYPGRRTMGDIDGTADALPDVVISRRYPNGKLKSVVGADYGHWEQGGQDGASGRWRLFNGSELFYQEDGTPQIDEQGLLRRKVFGAEGFVLPTVLQPVDVEATDESNSYLPLEDLFKLWKKLRLAHLQVKIHARLAYPFASLVLLSLGLPFVLAHGNRSMFLGLLVALAICFCYFLVEFVVADLGNREHLPPAVAAWAPLAFFGALGWLLFDGVPT